MTGFIDWDTLRTLCAEAGLEEEFTSYEEAIGANLKSALVNHFGQANRYLNDVKFRSQVDTLIQVIVAALTQSTAKAHPTMDMDALTKIFKEETESHRDG